MRDRAVLTIASFVLVGMLSGCVTEKKVLTNAQGETVTCETEGRIGIVSGIRLYVKQHNCIKKAQANGYTETSAKGGSS